MYVLLEKYFSFLPHVSLPPLNDALPCLPPGSSAPGDVVARVSALEVYGHGAPVPHLPQVTAGQDTGRDGGVIMTLQTHYPNPTPNPPASKEILELPLFYVLFRERSIVTLLNHKVN